MLMTLTFMVLWTVMTPNKRQHYTTSEIYSCRYRLTKLVGCCFVYRYVFLSPNNCFRSRDSFQITSEIYSSKYRFTQLVVYLISYILRKYSIGWQNIFHVPWNLLKTCAQTWDHDANVSTTEQDSWLKKRRFVYLGCIQRRKRIIKLATVSRDMRQGSSYLSYLVLVLSQRLCLWTHP